MNQGESKAEIPFKQGELFNPEDYAGDLLLTQEQFNAISRLEDKGCFIAERLKKRLPKTYQLVVACRSAGISIRQTMEICQVGYAVVAEIDKREKNSIGAAKEKIRAKCYYNAAALADLSGDWIGDLAKRDSLKPEELRAVTDVMVKLVEKGNLLSGESTENVEITAPKFVGWREMMKSAPAADVEILNDEQSTKQIKDDNEDKI